MKSVGEAMAIGRSFAESVQKALRSMETGLDGFDEVAIAGVEGAAPEDLKAAVKAALASPTPDRLLVIAQAYRHGLTTAEIHAACHYDTWFLERIREIVDGRGAGAPRRAAGRRDRAAAAEADGLFGCAARPARRHRARPKSRRVAAPARRAPGLQAHRHLRRRVPVADPVYVFLLRGRRLRRRRNARPIRASATRSSSSAAARTASARASSSTIAASMPPTACARPGIETIMVNCNPETVSTDYDTSDRLYFEPLTAEDVIEIVRVEQSQGPRARRHRAVRRPDPAQAREGAGTGARSRSSAPRPTRSTWPRTASASSSCCAGSACASRTTAPPPRRRRPRRSRRGSAIRS